MNEQLELIKKVEDEEKRCQMVEELINLKEAKIALLQNIIDEMKILIKAHGIDLEK